MAVFTTLFGDALLSRTSEIKQKKEKATKQFPLLVMGKYQPLPQITVRLGMPVYRMENGRTRTFQREYLATHPDAPTDLFTKDPESLAAQKAQHDILKKLVEDEGLLQEFHDGTQQTEPIIVTCTGVVVNGNRRLCAWRMLYGDDPIQYKSLEFIDVAVLPEECDEAEIRALEKRLQIQKTHRAEYKWHNKAAMLREEQAAGATPTELAKSYDLPSKKDVSLLIGALEYADTYLRKIGKPDQWSLVDGDEYAFKKMVEARQGIKTQGKKELFEAVCFKLLESRDYQGRLYQGIPDIAENLDALAQELREKGLLAPATPAQPATPDQPATPTDTPTPPTPPGLPKTPTDTPSTPAAPEEDDLDLLGGENTSRDEMSALATAVQGTTERLGGLVKQVIDEQKTIKAEQNNSKYLLKQLSNASRTLWNVRSQGLNENTSLEGVDAQIQAIRDNLQYIEQWIASRRGQQ